MEKFAEKLGSYLNAPVVTLTHRDVLLAVFLGFLFGIAATIVAVHIEKKHTEKAAHKKERTERRKTAEQYAKDAKAVLANRHNTAQWPYRETFVCLSTNTASDLIELFEMAGSPVQEIKDIMGCNTVKDVTDCIYGNVPMTTRQLRDVLTQLTVIFSYTDETSDEEYDKFIKLRQNIESTII